MNRERLVPKLRFEEFENDEEWVTYELGDISDVTKLAGFEYTKYVIYSEIGSIIALRGLNIKNGKIILDDVKYIDRSDFSKLDRSKLYQGDILLTYVGTIGNLAVIPENDKYYLAPNVARIRLTAGINPEFVTQRMGSQGFYRKIINPLIATSSQPALSMLNIRKFTLKIPGYKEQVKIGSHLNKLDEMIQLQQSKVNKVKDLKSAYLSEMFPKEGEDYPIRRFEGFHGSWETCHLGQVAGINKGEQLNKEKMIKSGKYYVLNGGINPSGYTNTYNTKEQTISISEGGNSCGYVNYNEEKFWSGGHNYALTDSKINVLYLYYFLKSRQDEIMSLRVGSGLPNIQITALSEFDISYPLRDEQEKIGHFFKNLDNQISIEEEKLAKLEKLKQAYLNDMFI